MLLACPAYRATCVHVLGRQLLTFYSCGRCAALSYQHQQRSKGREKRDERREGRGARNIVTGFAHLWNRISSGRTHMPFWHSAHRPCVHYAAYLVAFSCRCPYPDILILNLNSSPRRGALNLTYGHEYAFACECVCVCTCYSHVRRAKTKQRDEKDDGKDTQTRIFRCVRERERSREIAREREREHGQADMCSAAVALPLAPHPFRFGALPLSSSQHVSKCYCPFRVRVCGCDGACLCKMECVCVNLCVRDINRCYCQLL